MSRRLIKWLIAFTVLLTVTGFLTAAWEGDKQVANNDGSREVSAVTLGSTR